MVLWARMSDRGKDQAIYLAISLFDGAARLVVSTTDTSPAATIVRLCVTVAGINSYTATFWAVPGRFRTGVAAAGGSAMIVSIFMIGQIKDISQSFTIPLLAVAGFLLCRSILIVVFGRLAPADLRTKAGAARA